jgi:hypothetical protein
VDLVKVLIYNWNKAEKRTGKGAKVKKGKGGKGSGTDE